MNTRKATINDIKSIETLQSIYLYDNLTKSKESKVLLQLLLPQSR